MVYLTYVWAYEHALSPEDALTVWLNVRQWPISVQVVHSAALHCHTHRQHTAVSATAMTARLRDVLRPE
jgi:hypothetical protein